MGFSANANSFIDLVKLMIVKGAKNWNSGLIGACSGGYMEIVKLMIEKGATDCELQFIRFQSKDNIDVLIFLENYFI